MTYKYVCITKNIDNDCFFDVKLELENGSSINLFKYIFDISEYDWNIYEKLIEKMEEYYEIEDSIKDYILSTFKSNKNIESIRVKVKISMRNHLGMTNKDIKTYSEMSKEELINIFEEAGSIGFPVNSLLEELGESKKPNAEKFFYQEPSLDYAYRKGQLNSRRKIYKAILEKAILGDLDSVEFLKKETVLFQNIF